MSVDAAVATCCTFCRFEAEKVVPDSTACRSVTTPCTSASTSTAVSTSAGALRDMAFAATWIFSMVTLMESTASPKRRAMGASAPNDATSEASLNTARPVSRTATATSTPRLMAFTADVMPSSEGMPRLVSGAATSSTASRTASTGSYESRMASRASTLLMVLDRLAANHQTPSTGCSSTNDGMVSWNSPKTLATSFAARFDASSETFHAELRGTDVGAAEAMDFRMESKAAAASRISTNRARPSGRDTGRDSARDPR